MRARLGFLPAVALLVGVIAPTAALATGTLDQSQTIVTGHCAWSESYPAGQIFVAGQTGSLDTISLFPWDDLSTRGITIEIHAVSGGAPSTLLASQAWTTSTNGVFVDLTFSSPAQVTAGTAYAIVAVPAGSGFLDFGCSTVNDYAAGVEVYYIPGTGWDGSSVVDWAFRTYVTPVYQAPLQMGYWKKNAQATTALLPQTLGASYDVTSYAMAKAGFDAANCGKPRGDAVNCLAAQLLTAKLNDASGSDPCIEATFGPADDFLTSVAYAGPGLYALSKAQRNEAIRLKTILTNYLANLGCPA